MKTLKRIPPVQLTLLLLLVVVLGVATSLKFVARAQDSSVATWSDAGIGSVGAVQVDALGVFTVASTGWDIWGRADSFHFVYQALNGNGQIVARVLDIEGTNILAKAGVMIRETLATNSWNAMSLVTLGGSSYYQSRSTIGGSTEQTCASTNVAAPYWVKVVRSGDWVGGYVSADGNNWELVDWQTVSGLASQIYVGLALTSHDTNGTPSTARFDQVSIGPVNAAEVLNPLVGTGSGLLESSFNNRHLYGQPQTNWVDKQVDLGFLHLSAAMTNKVLFVDLCQRFLGISKKDEFGVRWTGELEAQITEPYTIYAESDDGVRVWLNEQLVIDDWDSHYSKEDSAVVNLVAGQRYLVRVEYYQNHGDVQMKLRWSSPSTPKRMIPASQLYAQPTDAGNNGLPDLWEQHYFSQTGVNPNADPDGDGLSNLQEWRRRSDPTGPLNWGVPNEWTHGDIEEGYSSGSNHGRVTYDGGIFTISSAGEDVWGRGDHFHYLYQAIGTNGEIVARVLGIQGTNRYAKAGVMIREAQESAARNAMQLMTVSNGMSFQWRSAFWNRTVTEMWRTNPATPYWLKLVRNNEWVGGYVSADGTNWGLFQWETFKGLAPKVFVGLAVAANNLGGTNKTTNVITAQFDQVNVSPADSSEVMNPVMGDGDGLLASFRNDSLQYLPGLTNLVESQVDRIWIHYRPMSVINPDSYGVCWSGEVQAQFTEPYTFILGCRPDNWVRVWVNDQLIINCWRKWHRNQRPKGMVNLVAGQRYLIRVEMFNNHDKGVAQLWWGSPSTPQRFVPQSQLYSQPLDADGNGLPDTWETLYFGHTGVNPNGDLDGDGLSNLLEYKYHTNPLKADTDNDGIPDAWEIAHGLDPQFDDAGLDYDNAGWSNLQKYLYGLDPFNPDINGDGLPDILEVGYLGVDVNTSHAGMTSVAATTSGVQATNFLGAWQVDGTDIYCLDRRGGVDFNLTVSNANKYVFNLIGTQNHLGPYETKFKLLLGIDGQTLGHYTLNAGFGTNGEVTLVLPYLQAGSHTVRVFWDGVANYSSLRIKQVKLLAVDGADVNHNGIKDWADKLLADESGLDATNTVLGSYTSPVCLEGRDPYPVMMTVTNNLTNALSPTATTDGRWYVNVPLLSTQTVVQASYQNGAVIENRWVQWQQMNLLAATNRLTIRKGDSLWLTALPSGVTNGNLQITYGTNILTGKAAKGIACKFTTPGVYTVTGTYAPASGSPQSGSITVNVVQQNLPNVQPATWTGMPRSLNLTSLAPEAVLQVDSRLSCFIAGTNANGAVRLALTTEENEERTILARLGTNGPVLDSTRVSGFDVWSGSQAYLKVLQVYPDGSQLVEMLLISSPVEPDVTFVLEPIASGVIFEDGTIVKTLDATSFDALGQYRARFVRPASVKTSVCHTIKAYQGAYQVGHR